MRSHFLIVIVILSLVSGSVMAQDGRELRLATTTSVESSGLLDHLLPIFESSHPYRVTLSVVGSGKALRLGRNGDVDLVWVHSPAAESQFVDDGYGLQRHTMVRNDFVIAGPKRDPAGVLQAADIKEALRRIAMSSSTFVSRADDSGTNQKEIELWQLVGIDPVGQDWYLETGAGMADSLRIAEDDGAYLLVDRATFLVRQRDQLEMLFEDVESLSNPYSLIAVNPALNAKVNAMAANRFIDWLTSPAGQQAIISHQHEGQPLYVLAQ